MLLIRPSSGTVGERLEESSFIARRQGACFRQWIVDQLHQGPGSLTESKVANVELGRNNNTLSLLTAVKRSKIHLNLRLKTGDWVHLFPMANYVHIFTDVQSEGYFV